MIPKTEYNEIQVYTTKDGSLIRELYHPGAHGNQRQSLAEATIPEGSGTIMHRHVQSEEIYHVIKGTGLMSLGDEQFDIKAGDTVCILPETPHSVINTGKGPLRILCCCSPAYSHEDTELL